MPGRAQAPVHRVFTTWHGEHRVCSMVAGTSPPPAITAFEWSACQTSPAWHRRASRRTHLATVAPALGRRQRLAVRDANSSSST